MLKNIDKIYIINLERRPDRKKFMINQMNNFKLNYKIVKAVDGNNLDEPINQTSNNKEWWNKYALGLIKTSIYIMEDAIKNEYNNIIIFEDDAHLDKNFIELFNNYKNKLPENWKLVHISSGLHRKPLSFINKHIFRTRESLGTHALLINKSCFLEILTECKKENQPYDCLLSNLQLQGDCYMFYPGIVTIPDDYSDITQTFQKYSSLYFYNRHPEIEKIFQNKYSKLIDPNDLCFCGSGLKYKKCKYRNKCK